MFGYSNFSFPLYRNYNRYNRYPINNPFITSNIKPINNNISAKRSLYTDKYDVNKKEDTSSVLNASDESPKNKINKDNKNYQNDFLDIFGIKLYFDDLIIISLLFFLYTEGVNDYYLFITLILILLS